MHSCFSSRRSSAYNHAVRRLVMDEVRLSMNTRLGVGALDEDGELEVDKVGVSVNTRLQVQVSHEDGELVAHEVGPRHRCPERPAAASRARTTDSSTPR